MTFKPPFLQVNGHLQTIYPSLFRKIVVPYERQRITLPDGDFLDLDWVKTGSKKLLIATHGLEGDSTRHYVTGMVEKFRRNGFDGLGWNSRSCSGEINKLPRFYHHGDAGDLKYVVEYAIKLGYEEVFLAGFSMGGSLTLRLLGEYKTSIPSQLKGAVVASVPLDLPTSVAELAKPGKRFYMNRFLKKLGKKLEQKARMFPNHPHLKFDNYWKEVKNFEIFDNRYTAPLHGYENAQDFYKKASSKPLLKDICAPVLIIQSVNDPFLSSECLDIKGAENNKNINLKLTQNGGHVGFMIKGQKHSLVEELGWEFCSNLSN
ncbi:YheT family hydrolase [Lacihabitans soyangensis]|uniref:Alpha/beta fold hydrolase n=1 Tax=Lacihabitans soyangensis TaxID=869394 RepID=A0AAE3H2H7_9BACT|nr:alpha/beta fold hydrolase [Lacihabitans soyangensis]MCP9763757.1 alpha/beta fold hydrolase [Lacihabitans soyangensis]